MPRMPPTHRPAGMPTKAESDRAYQERHGTSNDDGYTRKWGRARALYLASHPLCVMCERAGRYVPANVVDHVMPHRGDDELFWDEANWQSLCKRCHDGPKRRQENDARRANALRKG